jgi:hypothetical protein
MPSALLDMLGAQYWQRLTSTSVFFGSLCRYAMLFGGFDAALFQVQSDGMLQTIQPAPKLHAHPVGLSENIVIFPRRCPGTTLRSTERSPAVNGR